MINKKVWVIGIDGGTFDLCIPWMRAGLLPNMAQLAHEGINSELLSTIPPWTPPAWTSFLTGATPGEHGIFYFHQHLDDPRQFRLINGNERKAPALWEPLGESGISSAFINIPMTYPPPNSMRGILISGLDTPVGGQYTHPQAYSAEIRRLIGRDLVEPSIRKEVRSKDYKGLLKKALGFFDDQAHILLHTIQSKQYQFVAIDFRSTDIIQHHFWHFMDASHPRYPGPTSPLYENAIYSVYKRVDEILGKIMSMMDEQTTLIILSDHGFGPESARTIYLNNFLSAHGWLRYKEASGNTKSSVSNGLAASILKPIWKYLRHKTPEQIRLIIEKNFPSIRARLLLPAEYNLIDWSKTQAYADEFQENIWINLKGRESIGIVDSSSYKKVKDEIIDSLGSLIDPLTSQPVFKKVCGREEIYYGDHIKYAGDIVITPNYSSFVQIRPSYMAKDREYLSTLTKEHLSESFAPPGVHRPNGMLIVNGADINRFSRLASPSHLPHIDQIAGPILAAFGISPKVQGDKLFKMGPPTSQSDDETVMDRLKGLGYIE